jgi:predicted Zn-dependent peptidase
MARMSRLAGFTLYDDYYRPLDDMLAAVDAVSPDEIAAVAAECFPAERQSLVILGPANDANGKR